MLSILVLGGFLLLTSVETVKARSWHIMRYSGFQHWNGEFKLLALAQSKGHRMSFWKNEVGKDLMFQFLMC